MGELDRQNPHRSAAMLRDRVLRPEGFERRVEELSRRVEHNEPLWEHPLPLDELRAPDPRWKTT